MSNSSADAHGEISLWPRSSRGPSSSPLSRSGGFSRSTLEAIRASLPVVVSDGGGASEAVEEGVTGYCVPKGDVAAVHDQLSSLVRDAPRRVQMGRAGRALYEERFTFS
jgi:glycosyltransferase involved in cell wall biosynthesis